MIDESIRKDFALLNKSDAPIYFDNACMTLRPKQVIEAISRYYTEFPACAGRSNHKLAARVAHEVEVSRKKISEFVGAAHKEEIIFTRNTSESINLVSLSLGLQSSDMVVISGKEHNSNLVPWLKLKDSVGIKIRVVTDNNWKDAVAGEVKLVSVVMTSNLDGTSHPIKEIAQVAHKSGALIMVDAAQAIPHRRVSVRDLGVDFLAFSGHKMCGPSGMGVLYGKRELLEKMSPLFVGGDTVSSTTYDSYEMLPIPEKYEAGLQDYAGIMGLGAAVDYLSEIGLGNIESHELQLNKALTDGLQQYSRVKILGSSDPVFRAGIVSFTVDGADHHQIALMLDQMGNVAVRSGQHCVHSWFNAHGIAGSVRASVYFYNTLLEVEQFLNTFEKIMRVV